MIAKVKDLAAKIFKNLNIFRSRSQKKISVQVQKRPLTSFLIVLLALFLILLLGKILTPKVKETTQAEISKEVQVLSVGESPVIATVGKVKKEGVIVISAQTPGIVSKINVTEGQEVPAGKSLVSLSSTYSGGNIASLSRQLAQKQYQNVKDNFDAQKDLIQKQRDIANKSSDNTEQLRQISEQTNDDTHSLLSLNEQILASIDANLDSLVASNIGGSNDALILQTRSSKSQILLGINSLRQATRSLDYANNPDNNPTALSNIGKDITLKQLDLQEKALTLNKEVSQIQLNLAVVSEAMMFPSSPAKGVVQKIHVSIGQQVNPGTPLVTIYAPSGNVEVVVSEPNVTAKRVSVLSQSSITIGGHDVGMMPHFISTEAVSGNLYQIIFNIDPELQSNLVDGSFIPVKLAIEGKQSSGAFPFIPLDSVFQTGDSAFVYLAQGDRAVNRQVTLGEVVGQDVEINDGLGNGDEVILNRNILSGDKITIK